MPPEAITSPSGIWSTEIERPSHFGHLHCVVKKFGHTLKFSFNLFNPAFRVFQFGWLKGGPNLYFSTCLRKEYLYLCDFELDFELEKSVYICVCSLGCSTCLCATPSTRFFFDKYAQDFEIAILRFK